ncbi:undecaprenyl diphosphate synthase [Pectinatus brassicae]|uniref:Undecaprenyl diphosphate synthase n=1 Tax=Pectinatus brassicae TaxID=862415 RepID=A0A840UWG7_9FIRM|nr:polyprenyl diphosphate synthase [Pectinatus brassicae]MBB5337184.1 undecaprenyl diphosphate synthase [Pectinatus brassicae]
MKQEPRDFSRGRFRKLFSRYLQSEIEEMHANNVCLNFIGDIKALSISLQKQIDSARNKTMNNTGLHLNIAVNYGGRAEITAAVQNIAQEIVDNKITVQDIDEQFIDDNLYTGQQPAVDLLLRTGGDMRISNFLLWQCAYAELFFTNYNWPEFTPENFVDIIREYQKRDRRFGGLNAE